MARPVITEPGIYPDIDEDWYHSDCVQGGSLSYSGAKLLLPPGCPAVYKHAREHPKHTKSMDLGTRVHALVLGKGEEHLAQLPYDEYRTDKARAARDAAIAAGKIPTKPHEMAEAEAIAKIVRDHDVAGGLFSDGDAEQSMFWPDEEFGIWCRGRIDWLTYFEGYPAIVDLKTTADASPAEFAKSAAKHRYFMQDPFYRDGLAAVLGCDPDEIDFIFVVVQVDPDKPYLVMHYRLPLEDAELGREQNRIAREVYRDCTAADVWPAWSEDIEDLPLPGWARRDIKQGISDWYE